MNLEMDIIIPDTFYLSVLPSSGSSHSPKVASPFPVTKSEPQVARIKEEMPKGLPVESAALLRCFPKCLIQ